MALATLQGGVASRWQLGALGLSRGAIGHRVAAGRLTALHRGVFAVGHTAVGPRGHIYAALLAAGDGAVLSHRSAAAYWRIVPTPAVPEATIPGRQRRSRPDLRLHTAPSFLPSEVVHHQGLAITTPARTLLDLATIEPPEALERAVAEAQVLRLVTPNQLRASGRRALVAALDGERAAPTRNQLERALLALVADAGLPHPQVNTTIGGHEVDFAWPAHRLIAETDGWAAHGHRRAFERDRAKDADLQAAGWTVVRFTWRQIMERPLRVAARLAALLALSSSARPPGRGSGA